MNSIQIKIDSIKTDAFQIDSNCIDTIHVDSITHSTCETTIQDKSIKDANTWSNIDTSIKVSIVIFFLGFIIAEAIRRWNKSNELKQYKLFIEEWVQKSNTTLEEYITSLSKFSNEIKDNKDLNIARWRSGIIHLSEINKIPLEKFSEIYIFGLNKTIDNENRKQLMNFLYQLEYLNKATQSIKEAYDLYCENNAKIMDEWNTYYMQLIDLFGSIKTVNPQTFEDSIFLEISKLFIPLINTKDKGYAGTDRWKNEFIDPATNILADEKCLDFPILIQIMLLIRNLKIATIKHYKLNDYSKVFDTYIDNLKNAQLIINNSMSYFNRKKIRRFCK